jgi:hypothetical protein
VISWFSNFDFKCNLYRYISGDVITPDAFARVMSSHNITIKPPTVAGTAGAGGGDGEVGLFTKLCEGGESPLVVCPLELNSV